MDRVAKLKAAGQDLQLGCKVAKQLLVNESDETWERMESLACDNSQAKKYCPEKGSLEAILWGESSMHFLKISLTLTQKY